MLSKIQRSKGKLRCILRCVQLILVILISVKLFWLMCEMVRQAKPTFDYPLEEDFYLIEKKMSQINAIIAPSDFVPRPINPANFSLLLSDDTMCPPRTYADNQSAEHPELLLLVKTKPTSFGQRKMIRQTWGNPDCLTLQGIHSRTIFLLGSAASPEMNVQINLLMEHKQYKDLLQFDFVDDYRNNTYKVMSALQYVATYCTRTKFVILFDDDFLVHTDNLLNLISSVPKAHYPIYTAGHTYHAPLPHRIPWSKWRVSYEEYPYQFYPRFSSGGTIIMSMPVVRLLAIGLQFVRFFRIDDVLLGIVLQKYGISPMHISRVYLLERAPNEKFPTMISSHGFEEPHLLQEGWNQLKSVNVCSLN